MGYAAPSDNLLLITILEGRDPDLLDKLRTVRDLPNMSHCTILAALLVAAHIGCDELIANPNVVKGSHVASE